MMDGKDSSLPLAGEVTDFTRLAVLQPDGPGVWKNRLAIFGALKSYFQGGTGSLFAPVLLIEALNSTIEQGHVGMYCRFAGSGAKQYMIPAGVTDDLPDSAEIYLRNASNGDVTIAPAAGVIVNPPRGGTLVMAPGASCTLKRVDLQEWDLIGDTEAA